MPLRVKQPQHWPSFSRHLASLASLPFWGTGLSNDHLGQALGLCDMSVTILAKRPSFLEGLPAYATLSPLFHIICCIYLFNFIQIYSGTPCRAWMHSSWTIFDSCSKSFPRTSWPSQRFKRTSPRYAAARDHVTISDHIRPSRRLREHQSKHRQCWHIIPGRTGKVALVEYLLNHHHSKPSEPLVMRV